MRESRTSGSVRGAAREGGSYRDTFKSSRCSKQGIRSKGFSRSNRSRALRAVQRSRFQVQCAGKSRQGVVDESFIQ